jgi:hypothetical protein
MMTPLAQLALILAQTPPVTTVLTHGYSVNGEKGVWVEAMASAILARGGAGGAVCRCRASDGAWELTAGALDPEAPLVLIYNWLDDFEKAGPDWGFSEAAADALLASLRDAAFVDGAGARQPGFDPVAGRLLHFIGHSRGTCVNSEAVERLAAAGIDVDQVTTHDPHPVNGVLDPPFNFDWGDPVPRTWSNVAFADNYWRADGGGFNALDFDGTPVDGALNLQLNESVLNCCAYGFAHSDVHLWYHATIDLAAGACDGEECVTGQMNATWWPAGRAASGYVYAALAGGAAQRPPLPPGEPPGAIESIVNGGLAQGSMAGWLYHGGGGGGAVVGDGGGWALELAAAAGGSDAQRHNRIFLGADAGAVAFDLRVVSGGGGGASLGVSWDDERGGVLEAGSIDLAAPAGWITGVQVPIGPDVPRPRRYVLALEARGGSGPVTVRLDNLAILPGIPCPADLDGSGAVDVADLVVVILAWSTPAGDVNGDGVADVLDLVAVVLAWGTCA